jgi:uncharacterized membrane protein YfbV (UPF0208 family)
MGLEDPRGAGLAIVVILFVLVSIVTYDWLKTMPLINRVLAITLWFYALLRVYSASSFLWGRVLDEDLWPLLRYAVVALETAMAIMLGGVIWFRHRRRQ